MGGERTFPREDKRKASRPLLAQCTPLCVAVIGARYPAQAGQAGAGGSPFDVCISGFCLQSRRGAKKIRISNFIADSTRPLPMNNRSGTSKTRSFTKRRASTSPRATSGPPSRTSSWALPSGSCVRSPHPEPAAALAPSRMGLAAARPRPALASSGGPSSRPRFTRWRPDSPGPPSHPT